MIGRLRMGGITARGRSSLLVLIGIEYGVYSMIIIFILTFISYCNWQGFD